MPQPRLVSVTLAGSARDIIGDALLSVVDWVDWCLVVDTGVNDDTIEVARAIAGEKLVVRSFPWCDDFSAARNFALTAAGETGADWGVVLDTDERILLNNVDIKAALAAATEPALYAPHSSGTYTKDRFFRLPVQGEFRGPTHEAFYRFDTGTGAVEGIAGVVVAELEKSKHQLRQKYERDLEILRQYSSSHPDEPRWVFYVGDSLDGLGRHEEAVEAFRACAGLGGWREEAAWAMYRAAFSLYSLGRWSEALEACAQGMTIHPGMSELPWFAGVMSLRMGRYHEAIAWASMAIAVGPNSITALLMPRDTWRNPFGLWEGPYDVLRLAYRALGDEQGQAEAERDLREAALARAARESGASSLENWSGVQ